MSVNKKTARAAGVLYLIIIIAGISADVVIRPSLMVAGDAAATAANIAASEGLFRAGIAADLLMILADVGLAGVFYVLVRPVNQPLALLAAFFRLAQAAALGMNLVNLTFVLQLVGGAGYLSGLSAETTDALTLLFLEGHAIGYTLALAFFALNSVLMGYLLYKSGYFPRLLGVLLAIAGVGYLADTFARVLVADYAAYAGLIELVLIPAFIGEPAVALYLLIKGVGKTRTAQPPAAAVPQPDTA
jgi:hypothetical protein